jgi:hypothetical protein
LAVCADVLASTGAFLERLDLCRVLRLVCLSRKTALFSDLLVADSLALRDGGELLLVLFWNRWDDRQPKFENPTVASSLALVVFNMRKKLVDTGSAESWAQR